MRARQPELMNEWGTHFYGKAKTVTGDVWWYEERLSDGTIKHHPLIAVCPKTEEAPDPHAK